jgi:chromosome partitioning protein
MRRIALINQKGGVGKTTSSVNLGAALARAGRRVVLIDLDPQSNLSLHLDVQLQSSEPSTYSVLLGDTPVAQALRDTATPNLRLIASCIDLSGAELELANSYGREMVLREALDAWEKEHRELHGESPADYVLLDCPPSLGLLAINGLVAAGEAVIAVQTEFFALQGMTKLVDVVQLLRRRLNPKLEITGILPCLYDNRTKLAREVLGELRSYFPGKVFQRPIAKNVKLAEAPSYGRTIFDYAPGSGAALDYELVAQELMAQEATRAPELAARPLAPIAAPAIVDPAPAAEREATPRAKRAPAPSSPTQPGPSSDANGSPTPAADAVPESVPRPEDVGSIEPRRAEHRNGSSATALADATAVATLDPEEKSRFEGTPLREIVLEPFRAAEPPDAPTARHPALVPALVPETPASDCAVVEELPDLPADAVLLGHLEE